MKDTFMLDTDPNTGLKYIKKAIDEKTKNHQDDTELITAFMPEFPNSDRCPVKNFMFYMTKLDPRCNNLWQQVKDTTQLMNLNDTDIWYKQRKVGPNPLSTFMSRISDEAKLSKIYTNHSIRVTGTTLLGRCNFSSKQIMSVTGHRSVNSLSVYQKVSENEKLMMGMSMTCYLQSDSEPTEIIANLKPPTNIQKHQQILPKIAPKTVSSAVGAPIKDAVTERKLDTQVGKEVVLYEPEDPLLKADFQEELNFDIDTVLQEIEEENFQFSQNINANATTTTVEKHVVKKSPNLPLFNNCKIGSIGNIHIHVHKS